MNSILMCYPRLPISDAASLWNELRVKSFDEISEFSMSATTLGAVFYPMALARCSDEDLAQLRSAVLFEAKLHGFPHPVPVSRRVDFDQAVSRVIFERMDILPADAANAEVWSYINVRLLLDVLVWRYGRQSEKGDRWEVAEDRLFSMTRSAFGRLWWRAFLLGPEYSGRLREDEAVQIVERTRVTGYPPLARAIAAQHLTTDSKEKRMLLLRDAMKRFTRKLVVISVFQLNTQQISDLVRETFEESQVALGIRM